MSTPKHTPGKLEIGGVHPTEPSIVRVRSSEGELCTLYGNTPYDALPELQAEVSMQNAQRLVDCWNACEGINPAAVPLIIEKMEKLHRAGFWRTDSMLGAEIDKLLKLAKGEE